MDLISGLKSVALFQSLKSKKKLLKETQNEPEYCTKTASIYKNWEHLAIAIFITNEYNSIHCYSVNLIDLM